MIGCLRCLIWKNNGGVGALRRLGRDGLSYGSSRLVWSSFGNNLTQHNTRKYSARHGTLLLETWLFSAYSKNAEVKRNRHGKAIPGHGTDSGKESKGKQKESFVCTTKHSRTSLPTLYTLQSDRIEVEELESGSRKDSSVRSTQSVHTSRSWRSGVLLYLSRTA